MVYIRPVSANPGVRTRCRAPIGNFLMSRETHVEQRSLNFRCPTIVEHHRDFT